MTNRRKARLLKRPKRRHIFISSFIKKCKKKAHYLCVFFALVMVTTLALGGVSCRYIHEEHVIKKTIRKIPRKGTLEKKMYLRTIFRTLLIWASHLTINLFINLSVLYTLCLQIIIIGIPVCLFFLFRTENIKQINVLLFFYNGLNKLYSLGLWILFFHIVDGALCRYALMAEASVPFMMGKEEKVRITKEGNRYKVCINVPITYYFNSDSSIDRDIIIAILNEARDQEEKKIIVQQALAESFGLKDRREIDNRMRRYRKSGQSLKGVVAPHISRAWVLTEEVKDAIRRYWATNWWVKEEQVFAHLQDIGLFKLEAKFSYSTIRAAVSNDFLTLRSRVKRAFEQELISYKENELVKQLFDLVKEQNDLLKAHNLVPEVEQLKIEELTTFSRVTPLRKELKETARIRNIKTQIMNPHTQDSHLTKPLEAIKSYGYAHNSYGCIAHHLKVSKSTVFYWVQSFILYLKMCCMLPITCSGSIGFDVKYVNCAKSYSAEERSKGAKWRYVYIAVDCHTYDLLHSNIFPKENKNYTRLFLLQLKKKGIYPKAIITDMHIAYPGPIKEVFPEAKHAICIFHLLQAAQRHMKKVFGKHYMENKKVAALKKEMYHLFDAKDKRTVIKRMDSFMSKKKEFLAINPKASKIFNCIHTHFDQALLSIGNPYIPHTNNHTERVIRRFNAHYKNMAGFESMASAKAYLTLFAFFYRTTPLYEAKNKKIKGLSPLQIAGVDIAAIPAVKAFSLI